MPGRRVVVPARSSSIIRWPGMMLGRAFLLSDAIGSGQDMPLHCNTSFFSVREGGPTVLICGNC
eukprot:9096655-Ditylum_brightwellii.AAC.1